MKTQERHREICSKLSLFLEYPKEDPRLYFQQISSEINIVSERAFNCLNDFILRMKKMDLIHWQEHYVQSFDMMAQCPLYLSVHLFGEESFKRAELMVGLKEVYERNHKDDMSELPDHLAVILKKNFLFEEEEWNEFVSLCILPALPKMINKLGKGENPYCHVLKAIQVILVEMEKTNV